MRCAEILRIGSSMTNADKRAKRVTLQDIAKKTGVSTTTVSYVLNGTGAVGPVMRKRIRATAKKLGYRANHSAKATRTGKTKTIGLILPDLTNPFFPLLAQSIQTSAKKAGYAVFLIDSSGRVEGEKSGAEDLLARAADGIIWCPATEKDSLASFKSELPIVVIDRPLPDYDSVSADCYTGANILAEHLLEMGHTEVGMVTGPLLLSSACLRRDGFHSHFSRRGKIAWEIENEFSISLADKVRVQLSENKCSAIVCGNDLIALGVMRYFYEEGIKVPHDVSVVGFDDISWSSFSTPGLATVHQPFTALGREALELLVRRMQGDNTPRRKVSLDMRLTQRGSLKNLH